MTFSTAYPPARQQPVRPIGTLIAPCLAIPALLAFATSVRMAPGLWRGELGNPDSFMRMVRLRDIIDTGRPLSTIARDGSGHGTLLQWSHLIDGLLLLLALPFRMFLGPYDALHAAALIFGPLTIAAAGLTAAWAAAPFAHRVFLWLGAIMPAVSPAIMAYAVAGVVHHHVPAVLVALAGWGWAARMILGPVNPTAPIALGTWAAIGVWLTPETIPLTVLTFLALWLACFFHPAREDLPRGTAVTGLTFAVMTSLIVLADPPEAGLASPEIDRVSILHAGMAFAIAGAGAAPSWVRAIAGGAGRRVLFAAAIGLACSTIWVLAFRDALFHSSMAFTPEETHAFFDNIVEFHPVRNLAEGLGFGLTGALSALTLALLAAIRRSWLVALTGAAIVPALILGWLHVRFMSYPEAAAAIVLPIAVTGVTRWAGNRGENGQALARVGVICLFVPIPYLAQYWPVSAGVSIQAAHEGQPATTAASGCEVARGAALLAGYRDAIVLTDVSITPEILYRTQVRTVGSLYHENMAGFIRLRRAWRAAGTGQTVPPEIDAAEVAMVLSCRGGGRSPLVADLPSDTLWDRLEAGKPPSWLREVAQDRENGWDLYAVTRAAP